MKRLLLLLVCLLALCTGVCAAEPVISEMKTDCTLTGITRRSRPTAIAPYSC